MVDVTHDLLPEPYYYPMAPTVDDLVEYATEIDREGHCITFEWAVTEINNFSFSYVRIGLLANAVRRYRIYENPTDSNDKCQIFSELCRRFIGKSEWYVNKIIDAALVCYKLILSGFHLHRLPNCEAQARPLVKIYKQAQKAFDRYLSERCSKQEVPPHPIEVIKQKWQKVVDNLPAHLITANKISEIVEETFEPPAKKKVQIRTTTREKWEKLAREAGMTPDDYLEALLDNKLDNKLEADANNEESAEQQQQEEADWLEDVNTLVQEYDEGQRAAGNIETEIPDNGKRNIGNDRNDWYFSLISNEPNDSNT